MNIALPLPEPRIGFSPLRLTCGRCKRPFDGPHCPPCWVGWVFEEVANAIYEASRPERRECDRCRELFPADQYSYTDDGDRLCDGCSS